MPYDALQTLYRGTPSATVVGDWKFVGPTRYGEIVTRVGGDVTGTNPTMDITIQESEDGVTSLGTIATVPQIIDEMVGYIATATPRYEVPGEDPLRTAFKTGSTGNYIRSTVTLGGTTPVFNGVSVEAVVSDEGHTLSGR